MTDQTTTETRKAWQLLHDWSEANNVKHSHTHVREGILLDRLEAADKAHIESEKQLAACFDMVAQEMNRAEAAEAKLKSIDELLGSLIGEGENDFADRLGRAMKGQR